MYQSCVLPLRGSPSSMKKTPFIQGFEYATRPPWDLMQFVFSLHILKCTPTVESQYVVLIKFLSLVSIRDESRVEFLWCIAESQPPMLKRLHYSAVEEMSKFWTSQLLYTIKLDVLIVKTFVVDFSRMVMD